MSKITLLLEALGDEYSALKTTLDFYKSCTAPNVIPEQDEREIKNYCYQRQCELQIANQNVERKLSSLKEAYNHVLKSYAEATKSEKKDMIDELNAFQEQINFRSLIQESENVIMAINARITEMDTQMTILDLRKPHETVKKVHHANKKGHSNQHEDDDTKDVIDPLLGTHNEQPNDQYSSQQGSRTNNQAREDALDLTPVLRIKYPEIKLPTFSGDNDCWEEFWDTYSLIVHKNSQLGDLEKILYLKDALRNQALDAVKSIPKRSENYNLIVEILQRKFGNKSNNRSVIVQRLINVSPANNSAQKCASTLDKINDLVHQMVATGHDIRTKHDPLWIDTILSKFPYDVIKETVTSTSEIDTISVGTLLEALEKDISSRVTFEKRFNSITRASPKNDVRLQKSPTPQQCLFCHRTNHNSKDCRTVPNAADRRKALKGVNACWKCFSTDHRSRECNWRNCRLCNGDHNTSLCLNQTTKPQPSGVRENTSSKTPVQQKNQQRSNYRNQQGNAAAVFSKEPVALENIPHAIGADQQNTVSTFSAQNEKKGHENFSQFVLMTAEAQIKSEATGTFETVLIFLDTGAQCNLIDTQLADRLALQKGDPFRCTMHGIGGNIEVYTSQKVSAAFRTRFGTTIEIELSTKPILTNSFPSANLTSADIQFLEENNIFLSNPAINGDLQRPAILIGVESYDKIVMLDRPPIKLPSGLLAQSTVFGPALFGMGKTPFKADNSFQHTVFTCTQLVSDVKQELKNLYELEGMGINADEFSADDTAHAYLEKYSKRVSFDNGFITAPFPLKDNVTDLKDNYRIAICRLRSLHKYHEIHPEQKSWYNKILAQYENQGIIEPIPSLEVNDPDRTKYYMPHSGVWKEEKPVPLRVVFDASSKAKGQLSLNEVMYTGETFVNKVFDILLACRSWPIIVMADIQAAFTQIRICPEHRDLCRFLWLKDPAADVTPDNLKYFRFKRLPFGTRSAPSILNMSLTAFLVKTGTELSNEILTNIYVDNIFLKAQNENEALSKIKESKNLFQQVGMNLREFASNSSSVNKNIPSEDKGKTGQTKLLGVYYNTDNDNFTLEISLSPAQQMTKRELLSEIHKVYDPLGLAAPLLLQAKKLMREVITKQVDWNKKISTEQLELWNNICRDISNTVIQLPRNVTSGEVMREPSNLWIFSDASQLAIAACAYITNGTEHKTTGLLCGKSRLAPLERKVTIPRLELLAVLMSARLANSILKAYHNQISELHLVSDSKIALAWIKSTTKLPLFVANQVDRIKKIKRILEELGIVVHFNYVESEFNPADIATRPSTKQTFVNSDWLSGPKWWHNAIDSWPIQNLDDASITLTEPIAAPNNDSAHRVVYRTTLVAEPQPLINLKRFRYYTQALRVFSRAMKALSTWVSKWSIRKGKNATTQYIHQFHPYRDVTAEEITLSERLILANETKNVDIHDLHQKHKNKSIYRDEFGLIRAKSRLTNAALPEDTKNPIYIPPSSDLVPLIVNDIHKSNAHCGRNHTLSLIRMRFWIPRPSGKIRNILNKCVICKREQGLPFPHQKMAPLPKDRLMVCKPFQNSACDFMGPITIENDEKVYVALYTCLTTRAIHLELVESLSSAAFLDSFVRFISRRGVPRIMRSDCGTNFVLGAKVIELLFEKDEQTGTSVASYSASNNIKWIFNPSAAPWMGGAWERLIGCVKKCLNKTLRRKRLPYTKLLTVLTCIEAIINTRPLTKIDPDDLSSVPLRPVDFLQGNIRFALPKCTDEESCNDPNYEDIRIESVAQAKEALQFSEEIADSFWKRWRNEYLVELRELQKSEFRNRRHISRPFPQVGEIVILEQDSMVPRGNWPLAKVLEIIHSPDGHVRSAKVKGSTGRIYHRPVCKLIPLEIRSVEQDDQEQPNQDEPEHPVRRVQPPRKAKQNIKYTEDTENESEYTSTSNRYSYLSRMILYPIMFSLIPHVGAAHISCVNGSLEIKPPSLTYKLCFNDFCRIREARDVTSFQLPPSPHDDPINVSLFSTPWSKTALEVKSCKRQDFCDGKRLFTKSLLGNPHCAPKGVVAGTTVTLSIAILTLVAIITLIGKKLYNRKVKSNSRTEYREPSQTFSLAHFRRSSFILLAVLCVHLTGATACQKAHIRHDANLICLNSTKCVLEFDNEFSFNALQNEVCVILRHDNSTVGFLSLKLLEIRNKCNKQALFYTRDTDPEVFYEKRCPFMGSCVSNFCEKLQTNDSVPELRHAEKYPGYTMCSNTCAGLACGCLTPFPGCMFFRVAHVPRSSRVYHVFKCTSWSTEARLKMTLSTPQENIEESIVVHPYISTEKYGWSLKVSSIRHGHHPILLQRFAETNTSTIVIDDSWRAAVKCADAEAASTKFRRCEAQQTCACVPNKISVQCACSSFPLNTNNNTTKSLPIKLPHLELLKNSTTVVAIEKDAEITVLLSTTKKFVIAQQAVDPPCLVLASELTGCYDCQEAARTNLSCYSSRARQLSIDCSDQSLLVSCSDKNDSTTAILQYDSAHIDDNCYYKCGGQKHNLNIRGVLLYHSSIPEHIVLSEGTNEKHAFQMPDLSLPDLRPLIATFKEHWHVALASVASIGILALLTYLFGPAVLLFLLKLAAEIIRATLSILFTCLRGAIQLLAENRRR